MAESLAFTLHSGAATDSGSATAVDLESDGVGLRRAAEVQASVTTTAADLRIYVETSGDGAAWTSVGVFAPSSAPMYFERCIGGLSRYIRARWTATGAVEFSVSGTARQSYATPANLGGLGLPAGLVERLDQSVVWATLVASTGEARSYLGNKASTIVSVGLSVSQAVCKMSALDLMAHAQGVDAHPQAIELLVSSAEAARSWLKAVGSGKASADAVFVDDTPAATRGGGYAASDETRGWGDLAP